MNKVVSDIRLFLFTCSGEDNFILKRCNWSIQRRFALIGIFVVLIFVGCFLSALCFTYNLFDGARWVSFPMGIIWGAIVTNIYLLLLHTISPAIIPLASKKKRVKIDDKDGTIIQVRFLTISMFLRLGFMMLLAIIIAQPLNVEVLSSMVTISIEKHKIQERVKLYTLTNKHIIYEELQNQKELNQKIDNRLSIPDAYAASKHLQIITTKINRDKQFILYSTKKLKRLNTIDGKLFLTKNEKQEKIAIIDSLNILLDDELLSDKSFIDNLNKITISGVLKVDFNQFKSNLLSLVTEKIENYNKYNYLLSKSNFYIKTIQLLLIENPFAWLITIVVCLIFLVPIYLKYKARDISASIFKSKETEPDIVKLREELINTTNFDWLEKKIKSTNVREIKTSDYYFQRMLIEHKIILEEYDQTKKIFSKKLTSNIKQYNVNSLAILIPLLEKLKKIDFSKYQELSAQVLSEYKDEIVIKYEYWLDMPFRTKRVQTVTIINNEVGLLDFVYATDEDENEDSDSIL